LSGFFLVLFMAHLIILFFDSLEMEAVFVRDQVMRSGPGDDYLDRGKAFPGLKVDIQKISQQSTDWIQIEFSPGEVAWVPRSSLLLLFEN